MEFSRQPRLPVPPLAHGEMVVQPPPKVPKATPVNPVARLMPVAMLVAAVGMMAVYFTAGHSAPRNPMFMAFPVMMLVSVLGSVAYSVRGNRSGDITGDRRSYLRYLDALDVAIAGTSSAEHRSLWWRHPDPTWLWTQVGSRRMWERIPGEPDFCEVRVGVGQRALSTSLKVPDFLPDRIAAEELDPVTVGAMRRWIRQRSVLSGVPIAVPLAGIAVVTVDGHADAARGVLRSIVCQLAVAHGPEHLAITAAVDPSTRARWDWLKWLPHHQPPAMTAVEKVVVIADGPKRVSPRDGATILEVGHGDGAITPVRLSVDGRHLEVAQLDSLTESQAITCARRLAPYRPAAVTTGWLGLMGLTSAGDVDPQRHWTTGGRIVDVPIGVDEDGNAVRLDINEAARNGMGPHGLCVGATGSGKSEFLRTLVLGMITRHPPDALNVVLVDFKGGATFLGLERARHVAAIITNLADEAHLVARMNDALAGEINRRQELLRAAGSYANVTEYRRAQAQGTPLPPLPALFIVVDEFSELLTQHPEFAELFVAIGRLGRSLGVHLLLASQRLDEGRLRGLETHLSYRICLKTFSASESRAVLGVPDAYHLPSTPGAAYLKVASGDVVRFQTAYVSGPCAERCAAPPVTPTRWVRPLTVRSKPADVTVQTRTLFDATVDRLAGHGTPAHRVWLPPLTTSPSLDILLQGGDRGPLSVPIGVVDNPYQQRRDPLTVELTGPAGNVAIVGATRSGKSTTVRSLLLALADAHSPSEAGFYCLDFGGGSLSSLRHLPHVGAMAGRRDVDLCRRTVAEVTSLIRQREAAGEFHGDVFLVVDGWATLRQEFDGLEVPITAIAAQGLAFGVHVVVTAARWAELRPALKDQIATRIELRLGDPAESEMDRKRARRLSTSPPGRGLTADGEEFAVACPVDVAARVQLMRERWAGNRTRPVELLPARVGHPELAARVTSARPAAQPMLGLGDRDLAPVAIDFAEHSHLLVLGDTGCGKTSVLRLLCREIMHRNDAQDARIEIVDFRRSLLGVVESDHLDGYTAAPAALVSRTSSLIERLQRRMPGENVTQEQLRRRSWWSGPEIYLVIDDYDLVAAATGNPLAPLADFLPYARDLGLHVIIARRSGGAARAMFDPLLARLRELGGMGLMMSASPDEGVLLGSVRPTPLPPGRGTLVVRGDTDQLVQVAWSDPP